MEDWYLFLKNVQNAFVYFHIMCSWIFQNFLHDRCYRRIVTFTVITLFLLRYGVNEETKEWNTGKSILNAANIKNVTQSYFKIVDITWSIFPTCRAGYGACIRCHLLLFRAQLPFPRVPFTVLKFKVIILFYILTCLFRTRTKEQNHLMNCFPALLNRSQPIHFFQWKWIAAVKTDIGKTWRPSVREKIFINIYESHTKTRGIYYSFQIWR